MHAGRKKIDTNWQVETPGNGQPARNLKCCRDHLTSKYPATNTYSFLEGVRLSACSHTSSHLWALFFGLTPLFRNLLAEAILHRANLTAPRLLTQSSYNTALCLSRMHYTPLPIMAPVYKIAVIQLYPKVSPGFTAILYCSMT
jgi:hypothetical protein